MPTLEDLLPGLPFGLDCDAIPDIGIGLVNTAQELIDFEDSLSSNAVSTYPSVIDGRLTTESGVPVSTTDQTSKSTLYYTPMIGDSVPLYDATEADFIDRQLSAEISYSLTGLAANLNFDVFLNWSGSAIVISLEQWASATARNIALTTSRGVRVKSGALTHRYVGTIRTATSNATEDSRAKRFVWNYNNRRRRDLYIENTATNWTYSTNAWRSANNDNTLRVECVVGLDEDTIEGSFEAQGFSSGTTLVAIGIGLDSTTVNSATQLTGGFTPAAAGLLHSANYRGHSGIGYHYYQCLERGSGSGTQTFSGSGNGSTHILTALSMSIFN